MDQNTYQYPRKHSATYSEKPYGQTEPGVNPALYTQGLRLPQGQSEPNFFQNSGFYNPGFPEYGPGYGISQDFMFGNYNSGMLPMINMPIMNMISMQNMMLQNSQKEGEAESTHNELLSMNLEGIHAVFDQKIQDQRGCKQLQARVESEKNSSPVFELIFFKIIANFKHYSNDQYSNYLCQKIVELSSTNQLAQIVNIVMPDFYELSMSPYGTRVIQKIVENVDDKDSIQRIVDEIRGRVLELVKDVNGNHVIQKCLSYFQPSEVDFIYDEVISKCEEIATHKHGCCVIQRCIDYCDEEQIKVLIRAIIDLTEILINDIFGNYVVQYILELQGYEKEKEKIGQVMAKRIHHYCFQKFSSNVIEKALKVEITSVFESLMKVLENPQVTLDMITDQYANYVLQTALLKYRNSTRIKQVLSNIQQQIQQINRSEYGSKVLYKLIKVYDFLAQGDVRLKEATDQSKKKYKPKNGFHKKRQPKTGQKSQYMNPDYGFPQFDNRVNQKGFVNMNMNYINLNLNVNYQNSQGDKKTGGQSAN